MRLPIIVGMGGVNAAGRSSGFQNYRRMVLDALPQALQEQTLTIVPKMLAVVATIVLLMPWILGTLYQYTVTLFSSLAAFGHAG